MVTKDYQKGVYEWVTLGIRGGTGGVGGCLVQKRYVAGDLEECNLPSDSLQETCSACDSSPSATKLAWRHGSGLVSLTSRLFTSWLNL